MMRQKRLEHIKGTVILIAIIAICITVFTSFYAKASDLSEAKQRVFDYAGLFTSDQTDSLEESAASLRKAMKMDVVIVTEDNTRGKPTSQYADDFYDEGGFGTRNDYSGVLFLIDMDNRELTISTSGDMIRFLTDRRIEKILDRIYEYASAEDYNKAAQSFLSETEAYFKKGIQSGQYNFDTETGAVSVYRSIRWYEAALALGVSSFVAFSVCAGVKQKYAMKSEHKQAENYRLSYRAGCGFAFREQKDNLIHKSVSQMLIASSSSSGTGGRSSSGRSSTHTSGMGRSHGGGSRKF